MAILTVSGAIKALRQDAQKKKIFAVDNNSHNSSWDTDNAASSSYDFYSTFISSKNTAWTVYLNNSYSYDGGTYYPLKFTVTGATTCVNPFASFSSGLKDPGDVTYRIRKSSNDTSNSALIGTSTSANHQTLSSKSFYNTVFSNLSASLSVNNLSTNNGAKRVVFTANHPNTFPGVLALKDTKISIDYGAKLLVNNIVSTKNSGKVYSSNAGAGYIKYSNCNTSAVYPSQTIENATIQYLEGNGHYTFNKWTIGSDVYYENTITPFIDGKTYHTVYVTPKNYKINFVTDDLSGEDIPITVNGLTDSIKNMTFTVEDEDSSIPDVTAKKGYGNQYTFHGWQDYTLHQTPNVLYAKTPAMIESKTSGLDRVLFPVFTETEFKLKLINSVDNSFLESVDLETPSEFVSNYTYKSTVTLPKPDILGYSFAGWATEDGDPLGTEVSFENVDTDRTYIAQFTKDEYKVKYKYATLPDLELPLPKNGESLEELNPTSFTIDTSYKLEPSNLEAFDFVGWYEVEAGLIPRENKQYNVTLDMTEKDIHEKNRTYVAYYVPHGYNVTYEFQSDFKSRLPAPSPGQSLEELNPISVNVETNHVLQYPDFIGYDFKGWYETKAGLISKDNMQKEVTLNIDEEGEASDRHYIAYYTPTKYTIKYEFDSSCLQKLPEPPSDKTLEVLNPTTLTVQTNTKLEAPVLGAYDFKGWYEKEAGFISKDNMQKEVTLYINNLDNEECVNRTYVAYYEPHIFTITYNNTGEKVENPEEYDISKDPYLLNNPQKKGYTFLGWKERASSTASKQSYLNITPQVTSNLEYTAIYQKNTYNISYKYSWKEDLNSLEITGTPLSENPITFGIFGDNSTLDGPEPKYELIDLNNPIVEDGYEFVAWEMRRQDPDTEQWTDFVSLGPSASLYIDESTLGHREYVAIYKAKPFNINYIYNNIHLNKINISELAQTYTHNKDCYLGIAKRSGYSFNGFYLNDTLINKETNTIEKGSIKGDIDIRIEFSQNTETLQGIVKIRDINGNITDFKETDKIPVISFNDGESGIMQTRKDGDSIIYFMETPYRDGKEVKKSIVQDSYNNNKYEFLGWFETETSPTEQTKKETDVTVVLQPGVNVHVALFRLINYSIDITLQDPNGINNLNIGEILYKIPEHAEVIKDVEEINNPKITIKKLQLGDICKFSAIPYTKNKSVRYDFSRWGGGIGSSNSIVDVQVVKEWRYKENNTESIVAYFDEVDFIDTIGRDPNKTLAEQDQECLSQIINKTITDFIAEEQLSKLGDMAFCNCDKLKYVFLPGVKSLGKETFKNCKALKVVILSTKDSSGSGLGENAFLNCNNLNTLILPDNFISLNTLFSNTDTKEFSDTFSSFRQGLGIIYVPDAKYVADDGTEMRLIEKYQTAPNWCIYAECFRTITPQIYNRNEVL